MYCSTHRFTSSRKGLAALLGAVLLSLVVGGCSTTAAIADWWKGDFVVNVRGVPPEASHFYFILGDNGDLTAAEDAEDGYAKLLLNNGVENQVEGFGYVREPKTGKWRETSPYTKNADNPLTTRSAIGDEEIKFRVARHRFKKEAENTIAVMVRYPRSGGWKGVTVEMKDFRTKEQAVILVKESELRLSLYDQKKKSN